jgi:hypothetical protein
LLEDGLSEIDPDGLEVLTLAEVSQRRRPRIEDVMCGNIIANRRIRDREDLRGSRTPDADLTGSLLLVGVEPGIAARDDLDPGARTEIVREKDQVVTEARRRVDE